MGIACSACVDFFDEFLGVLIKGILQIGVVGSCGELCSLIPNQYGQVFCTLVCLGVCLDEFVHMLQNSDLDPVYLCAETHACPPSSCSAAHCTSIENTWVTPAKGKQTTGTGLTVFAIRCPNCNKQGIDAFGELNEGFQAGTNTTVTSTLDTAE